ncbi:unnamed protein product [Miscanthus lutarioriparius]|uniref:Uncharacterized protein n=1 Tax=Miscanthus lutarioriparius TaxID=422564 RepID=A0A811QFT7_9POAL|nr:unnamed protein product [Miscanthus lutarioriparius]
MSLHADLLGDPVARIRHSPHYLRAVRGWASRCSWCVSWRSGSSSSAPSTRTWPPTGPTRRRCVSSPAAAGSTEFRSLSLLVHPVHSHRLKAPRRATVVRLGAHDAEQLYRSRFVAHVELFPADIGHVLDNALSRGTFLAIVGDGFEWGGDVGRFLASPPESWAVASAWHCGGVFRLEWLRVPSVPVLFRPFAGWFVYGLAGSGRDAALAAEAVFASILNMARGRAAAVAVEVEAMDPLGRRIPHRLSCTEDVWCMKRLGGGHADGWDWARSAPAARPIFVDPWEV